MTEPASDLKAGARLAEQNESADDATANLSLIARQQRQSLSEMSSMRREMNVVMALLQRLLLESAR